MALATQCPHCGTTFRVAHDQLKLRGGLVRCGACKEIFNGIEQLLPAATLPDNVTDATVAPLAQPAEALAQPRSVLPEHEPKSEYGPESDSEPEPEPEPELESEPRFVPEPDDAPIALASESEHGVWFESEPNTDSTSTNSEPSFESATKVDDPLQRMTLMDFSSTETYDQQQDHQEPSFGAPSESEFIIPNDEPDTADVTPDPLDQVIDDLQRKPLRTHDASGGKHHSSTPDAPDFMLHARQKQGRLWLSTVLAFVSFILFLGLLAQGAFAFRNQIAAWIPQAKPLLSSVCTTIGCRINLPMQIDQITIESNELLALTPDKNTFSLTVLLRNHSTTIEAWPQIELTLNDTGETPVLRRVFAPRDYLPRNYSITDGFAANTEASIRIHFTLNKPKAAGYRIDLFYP